MCKRTSFGVVLALILSASGCAKGEVEASAEGTAAAGETAAAAAPAQAADPLPPESTIVEEGELGTITWSVTGDGHVEAAVKRPDGQAVTKDITGMVTWPGEIADDQRALELGAEGHLFASGPALEQDLTEIDYDLVIEGKPWSGVLHVPRGGTRAIAAEAQSDSAAVAVPEGKRGPNGGVIQVIGGEPVELVADSTTGEVRVYFLGPNFEVIDPGERRVRLGYVADISENVELVRDPGGPFFVTSLRTRADPVRLTLAWGVGASAAMHVGIVGFRFGARLGVGVRAPVLPVWYERRWAPSVAVRVHHHVDVRVHRRVEVGGRVDVRDRVVFRDHDRGRGRGHDHDRGKGHDRDHGRGHDRDHGVHGGAKVKVHVNQHDHGRGHGGPSRGGGGKGKKR